MGLRIIWLAARRRGIPPAPGILALLMNTVLFDGKWLVLFGFTRDGVFHGADGDVDIPMMK